jgi:bifunctional DNA-binding transcriptional regulator/antitoxin component of YhaV-PrlF toxin-antitoxin module
MVRKSKGFAEPKAPYRAPRSTVGRVEDFGLGRRKLPPPEALPDGTVRYFLMLGPKGRVLLPADVREAMDLREGDVITGWLKDGELRMHSHLHGLRKIQIDAAAKPKNAVYASDELIAERRAEAAKEDAEAEQWLRMPKRKR